MGIRQVVGKRGIVVLNPQEGYVWAVSYSFPDSLGRFLVIGLILNSKIFCTSNMSDFKLPQTYQYKYLIIHFLFPSVL